GYHARRGENIPRQMLSRVASKTDRVLFVGAIADVRPGKGQHPDDASTGGRPPRDDHITLLCCHADTSPSLRSLIDSRSVGLREPGDPRATRSTAATASARRGERFVAAHALPPQASS